MVPIDGFGPDVSEDLSCRGPDQAKELGLDVLGQEGSAVDQVLGALEGVVARVIHRNRTDVILLKRDRRQYGVTHLHEKVLDPDGPSRSVDSRGKFT